MKLKEIRNMLLLCEIGSTAHGCSVDGQDDLDLMGIYHEEDDCIYGLKTAKTYTIRDRGHGERSQAGDTDIVVYPFRKFCALAYKSNPTILNLFFAPVVEEYNPIGGMIRSNANLFVSKKAATTFMGYATHQKKRLLGELGQKKVKRPELEERYGYDTKYAYHILRLCIQGCELLRTGTIRIPMKKSDSEFLKLVRTGGYKFDEVIEMTEDSINGLKIAERESDLPEEPDVNRINTFMRNVLI